MSTGRYQLTLELAAVMGLGTQKLKFEGLSEQWFRKRMGLAVHVPNFGLALLSVLSTPLHGRVACSELSALLPRGGVHTVICLCGQWLPCY